MSELTRTPVKVKEVKNPVGISYKKDGNIITLQIDTSIPQGETASGNIRLASTFGTFKIDGISFGFNAWKKAK